MQFSTHEVLWEALDAMPSTSQACSVRFNQPVCMFVFCLLKQDVEFFILFLYKSDHVHLKSLNGIIVIYVNAMDLQVSEGTLPSEVLKRAIDTGDLDQVRQLLDNGRLFISYLLKTKSCKLYAFERGFM